MRPEIFRGRYLFQMHTTPTDGEPAASGDFAFAAGARADSLVFLEHIPAAPKYNVATFVKEVAQKLEPGAHCAGDLAGWDACQ